LNKSFFRRRCIHNLRQTYFEFLSHSRLWPH